MPHSFSMCLAIACGARTAQSDASTSAIDAIARGTIDPIDRQLRLANEYRAPVRGTPRVPSAARRNDRRFDATRSELDRVRDVSRDEITVSGSSSDWRTQ